MAYKTNSTGRCMCTLDLITRTSQRNLFVKQQNECRNFLTKYRQDTNKPHRVSEELKTHRFRMKNRAN